MIRVAVAIALLYVAYRVLISIREIKAAEFPIVGHMRDWMIITGASVTGIIGALLFVGAWTQPLGILAAMIASKHAFWSYRYPSLFPLSTGAYLLLMVMSITLIFSGAGAFAFDWPL